MRSLNGGRRRQRKLDTSSSPPSSDWPSDGLPLSDLIPIPNQPSSDAVRAAWWWIDRWRKSTAFLCMSLEEQGLYRNLLDAVWIFPDHVIPDLPRVLLQASGATAEEWARSGPNVLAAGMQRVDGGWTNNTALEVIGQGEEISKARSEAGRRGAASRWHTDGKPDGKGHGKPDSKTIAPSPSPSPSPDTGTDSGKKTREAHPRPGRRCPPDFTLTTERSDYAIKEGLSIGQLNREFAKFTDCEFRTPHHDWDATWRNWVRRAIDDQRKGRANGRSTSHANQEAVRAFLDEVKDDL